ncbi:hypothetical protein N0V85_009694, partial [Neurospora sp. IMI 360204]
PGEETDSDDESWCFIEDVDEEEDNKKGDKNRDGNNEGNADNKDNKDNNSTSSKDENENGDDYDEDNDDEWHDCCHHCHHHCQQSFRSIATQTTSSTTNPQPQLTQEDQIPLISPALEIFQSSPPTSLTIQLAIPGAKRRDISVAYDRNTNMLTLSGVLNNFQSQSQSQSQSQNRTTTAERRIPIGRFSREINFVTYSSPMPTPSSSSPSSSTPGGDHHQQQQYGGVDHERIRARLEDGVLTVVVPLVVEGESESSERTGREA